VRRCQPDVSTAAQINASRALREATLDPCPQGVWGFEFRRLLALPRGLDGLVVGVQPDRELAWGAFRRGTRRAGGARTTSRSVKPNANHGIARRVVSRPPVDAGMALGTARLLGVPIQDKGLSIVALAGVMWPAIGADGGPHPIDLMLGLGRHQAVGIPRAAVKQVGSRQQLLGGSIVHARRPHHTIRYGGGRRDDLGHQLRLAWIAGLREVHRIAHPVSMAFPPVARLEGIGRGDAHR
jgi:hypothetical protein